VLVSFAQKYFLLLLLCWGVAASAAAQAGDAAQDTVRLKDVVISAHRVPTTVAKSTRSISIITQDQLKNLPVQSVQEALAYVAGIDIRQRGPLGTQADISIRGGTFNQVLILLDGLMLADPQTGHHLLNLPLQLQDIDRIEILKGSGASVYGQNAFAGAINIVTKKPESTRLGIQAVAGSFGYVESGASAAVAPKGEPYTQLISGTRRDAGSYNREGNTDFGANTFFYKGNLNLTRTDLQLATGYNARQFGAYRYYFGNPREYESIETFFASLSSRSKGKYAFTPQVFFRRHFDDYRPSRESRDSLRNRTTTDVVGLQLNSKIEWAAGITAIGGNARMEQLRSNGLGNNGRYTAGVFIEHQFMVTGRFTLSPAVYTNYFSTIGWNVFPSLDAGYVVNDHMRIVGNVGRSFRVPTYTELYLNRFVPVTPAGFFGDEALRAEEAWTYEIGWRQQHTGFNWDLTVFQRQASQQIDFARATTTEPFRFRNVTGLATTGYETNLAFQPKEWWGKRFPVSRLHLGYTYLSLNQQATDLISRYVFNYLRHQLVAQLTSKLAGPLHTSLTYRFQDRVGQPTPYMLLDARIFWQHNRFMLYLEGSNLTNTTYYEIAGIQMPGLWLRGGFHFNILGAS